MSQETTLSSTSSAKVSHSLKLLSQLQEKREEELAGLPIDVIHNESDVENDSFPPMLEKLRHALIQPHGPCSIVGSIC